MSRDTLWNPDLAPTDPDQRTWTLFNMATLWVGMSVCIPTYQLAAGLIDGGMNWFQAVLTIGIGNAIVLVPMVLNAHAGTRYGIPYPVLARASFGVLGSNIPALLRALVACGWFGIQSWIGGHAIYMLVVTTWAGFAELPLLVPSFLGINTGQFLSFLLFWLFNLYFIWKGTESIKWLEALAAPFLTLLGLALLIWAYVRGGGFGPILSLPARFESAGEFWRFFFPSLTAMVGFWATLSLNIPDFSRFVKSQRAQVLGQAIGLPPSMVLFSFIGVAVTSATPLIFGEVIWDPIELLGRIGRPMTVLIAMIGLSIATLSTNLAANVVSPANDFSNLAPSRISFRAGGYITAVIGVVMMPWKLIESSQGYIFTWLIGYAALLGPIGGILIADYWILRKQNLTVDDLYRRGGAYEYRSGFNPVAIAALVLGVLPNVPGFLATAFPGAFSNVPAFWTELYSYSWFLGFLLAGGLYLGLTKIVLRRGGGAS